MTPRFSVIIPTYQREELLARCLGALTKQRLRSFEVIVANDDAEGAEVATRVAQLSLVSPVSIRVVHVVATQGPAGARNAAAKIARGEVLAFTDDDCIPQPEWLGAADIAFREPELAAAWGAISMPIPRVPSDYERNEAGLETAGFVTANCFCRRSVFDRLGGFDENFLAAWREDSDFYFRLLTSGFRVDFIQDALVMHPVRRACWGISMQQQRKAMFDALLFKKHPQLYRQCIRTAFPVHYYSMGASLILGLGALLADSPNVGAFFLGAYGVQVLLFAIKRLRGTRLAPAHILEMLVTSAVIPLLSVFWRLYGAYRFKVRFA